MTGKGVSHDRNLENFGSADMEIVYKAEDNKFDLPVTLKLLFSAEHELLLVWRRSSGRGPIHLHTNLQCNAVNLDSEVRPGGRIESHCCPN
jgi:hypothetical protein